MEEPGRLQSMWSYRVGHDLATEHMYSIYIYVHQENVILSLWRTLLLIQSEVLLQDRHFREADPGFCRLLQRKMHASFKEKLVSVENGYSEIRMNRLVFMVALPSPQKARTEEYKESITLKK